MDRSLAVYEGGGDGWGGRYRLLGSVRQYARDRLLEAEHDDLRAALEWSREDRDGAGGEVGRETGFPIVPLMRERDERDLTAAREALGEDRFARAWEEGRAMSLDRAVEYALSSEGAPAGGDA